jgi:hemerythrin-like domain-containing protein
MNELIGTMTRHHGNFRRMLDIAETEIKVLENGGKPDYMLLRNIMLYLTRYAVPFHSPVEEAIYERLLTKDLTQQDLVERLQRQQEMVRDSGPSFLAELDAMEAGALMPRALIGAPGRIYASALRRHMTIEEEELFPAALRLFGADDWNAVPDASTVHPSRSDDHYRDLQELIVHEVGCSCMPMAA